MKLGAFDHPKTMMLKSALQCPFPAVIGHLELLWRFTAQHAPHGDIGKWPDSAIAEGCFWDGDPVEFVEALVNCGYLDRSERHRILVHDWPEHCPRWILAKLKKLKESFAEDPPNCSPVDPCISPEARSTDDSPEPSPSLAMPNHVKSRTNIKKRTKTTNSLEQDMEDFNAFWASYPIHKAKAQARRAWQKLAPSDEQLEQILAAITAQKRERDALKVSGRFVPPWKHPATWLNGACWEDEQTPIDLLETRGRNHGKASNTSAVDRVIEAGRKRLEEEGNAWTE